MKKAFGWLLALALMTAMGTAYAAETEDYLGKTHYGVVYHADFEEALASGEVDLGPAPEDASRVIFISSSSAPIGWAEIPEEGPDAEAYVGKGVRFTVDEASFTENVKIVRPALLEIAGDVLSGTVLALSDTDVALDSGERLQIGADTIVDPNLVPGMTCEVIVDGEQALYLFEVNG